MKGWVELYIERAHRKLAELDSSHHLGSRCRWCMTALDGAHLSPAAAWFCSKECGDAWRRELRRRSRPKPRVRRRAGG